MATKFQILYTILLCLILAQTLEVSAKSRPSSLTREKSSEGSCIHVSPTKMDAAWLIGFVFEAKYVPMASELAYLSIGTRLGKTLQSWSELKKLCMKVLPQVATHGTDWTGFGKTVFTKCDIKGVGVMKCSEGGENDATVVVTWTDFKDYLISIVCQPNGQKSWMVYSTKKKVDSKTRKIIISHIKDHGFAEEKAKTASYDSC